MNNQRLRWNPFLALLLAGGIAPIVPASAAAPKANLVLGQPNSTTGAPEGGARPGLPLTLTTLYGPGGVAVSPPSFSTPRIPTPS